MTEQGEKWIWAIRSNDRIHHDPEDVLRAFCDEVEKRAQKYATANAHGVTYCANFVDYSEAFDELKRELLGGDDGTQKR